MKPLAGLGAFLLAVTCAGCSSSGDGGAPSSGASSKQWTLVVSEGADYMITCGSLLVRERFNGTSQFFALGSADHGATWQFVPLENAAVEYGSTGVFWRQGPRATPPVQETTDCGVTWRTIMTGEQFACFGTFTPIGGGTPTSPAPVAVWRESATLFAAARLDPIFNFPGAVCSSTDNGASWSRAATIGSISLFAVRAGRWLGQQPDHVFVVSDDHGESWRSTGLATTQSLPQRLLQSAGNPPAIYMVGASAGSAAQAETLWRWDDATASWLQMTPALPAEMGAGPIRLLAVDPADALNIVLTTDVGAFWSRDGGRSWTTIQGVQTALANALVFDPTLPHRVYLATQTALWAVDVTS